MVIKFGVPGYIVAEIVGSDSIDEDIFDTFVTITLDGKQLVTYIPYGHNGGQ